MDQPARIDIAVGGDVGGVGGGASPGQAGARNPGLANPLINVRDRLFYALFIKAALSYARTFPKSVRRYIEFTVLLKVVKIILFLIFYFLL